MKKILLIILIWLLLIWTFSTCAFARPPGETAFAFAACPLSPPKTLQMAKQPTTDFNGHCKTANSQ
jgi:hypothetical protein